MMLQALAAFLGAGLVMGVLDALWLTTAVPRIYQPAIGPLLADKPNMAAAIAFYLIYVAGIVLLAIWPNRDAGLLRVAATGAALGFVAYATYDLTNQATLKMWSVRLTVIDMTWGTVLTAASAAAGWAALRWAYRIF